jgi:hypothetical protein
MITSVKQIKTMKAIDLPHTFDVQIGLFAYPMEITGTDENFVYVRSTDTGEDIHIPSNEMVTILVPDTWENASLDIEFDLMKEGLI